MRDEEKADFVAALARTRSGLGDLARSSESAIVLVFDAFQELAGQAGAILRPAASIVACVENENVATVLANVQVLCASVKKSLGQRLETAGAIFDMLKDEEKLLGQLTRVRLRQESIAAHLKGLSVLTNVEVARLRGLGGDFELLARELSQFSKTMFEQTRELASQTQNCERTIAETRRELAASLPQLKREMEHMVADIGQALQTIEADLAQMASVPAKFRNCAEMVSQQIAGVIAAIQSHDITRQQIEHVRQGLALIESKMSNPDSGGEDDFAMACAGLKIQSCQLQNIRQTVDSWTSQVARCMAGIQQLSASELVAIGPLVLNQERELSSQLANISLMQNKSQNCSTRIESTLRGLSSLLELVNEHLGRSQNIRRLLRLLTFNSLIEAHRLGQHGAAVSAIANLIKSVSLGWSEVAEQSNATLNGILKLVKETDQAMEVFSKSSGEQVRQEQAESRVALDTVREAAEFVGREAAQMQAVTARMQAGLRAMGDPVERLQNSFRELNDFLEVIESLAVQLQMGNPELQSRCDFEEVERLFSAGYTTEIERAVMQSAIHGTRLPEITQSFAGNAAELF